MTPSKSMPKINDHDFEEKYPDVRVGTLISMLITDILTKIETSKVLMIFLKIHCDQSLLSKVNCLFLGLFSIFS